VSVVRFAGRKIAAPAFAAAVLGAGGLAPAGDDPAETRRGPIVAGQDSDPAQDAVVLLVRVIEGAAGQETSQCTGTLVAPNLVLTARHCVSRTLEGRFRCDEAGRLAAGSVGGKVAPEQPAGPLYVFAGTERPRFGTGAARPDATVAEIFHDGADVLCGHDLALARLDRPVAGRPIAPLRLDGPPLAGEALTVVGWGVTETASEPARRQQRAGVAIQRVGPAPATGGTGVPAGPVAPREFQTGEVTCNGDSGGPAFAEATGAIVGVTSAGGNGRGASRDEPAAGCAGVDAASYFTAVPSFGAVFDRAFAAAGARPWREGQALPPVAEAAGGCALANGPSTAPLGVVLALSIALGRLRFQRS
jgi:hypothetical protein